jgi:hypothetical protein
LLAVGQELEDFLLWNTINQVFSKRFTFFSSFCRTA